MQKQPSFAVIIIWQSLVVSAYRAFFYRLARSRPDASVTLVAPERFPELGFQDITAEPFDAGFNRLPGAASHLLRTWAPHTQIVLYRGLGRVFDRFKRESSVPQHRIVVSIAEPYSVTSLWVWFWARVTLGSRFSLVLYGAQNIRKQFPWPLALIQKFLLKRAKAVLVLGAEQEKVLRLQGYQGKAIPFPLWFNSEQFKAFGSKADALLDLQSLVPRVKAWQPRGLVLGFAGTLNEQKGIRDLLEALRLLSPGTEISLLVVGDGPLRNEIAAGCQSLTGQGLPCLDLGGLPLDAMAPFYRTIDLLVVPSRTMANVKEQFGRVIIEAMACGAAVIGSDSGEIPQVIGRADRVFAEANPKGLAAAIEAVSALKKDPAQWAEARTEALARAEGFSDETLSAKFGEALAALTAS